jgi:DNA modification methylase
MTDSLDTVGGAAVTEPQASHRPGTATSAFGVSRRESHDATAFYERFGRVEISDDQTVVPPAAVDTIWCGDARDMERFGLIADSSVALVVTSPPYFAGKEYETALGQGHVPATFEEYLQMLEDVFAECRRKLEPGGRMAVNVGNLGRRPYRSLAADVVDILQRRLGFLPRGEIIWVKSKGANGSCAWGTYQRPGNPVLRDLTERVVVASKGRFDRAVDAAERCELGLPHEGSMFKDEFMDATTDVWEIPAESATRVGHPAPFPVELPQRLIDLYTYRGDLVLDPFMGSGSTAVAAVRAERHFVGFDTDPAYVAAAVARVQRERARANGLTSTPRVVVRAASRRESSDGNDAGHLGDRVARSVTEGCRAKEVAGELIAAAGFSDINTDVTIRDLGVGVTFTATDPGGHQWLFELCGAFSITRPGLKQSDTLLRTIGKASLLHAASGVGRPRPSPLIVLTTDRPAPRSSGRRALDAMTGWGKPIQAVVDLLDGHAVEALRGMASFRTSSD